MYQDFMVTEIKTDLISKQVYIVFNLDVDSITVDSHNIKFVNSVSNTIELYDVSCSKNIATLTLKDYPVPNQEYILIIDGTVKDITNQTLKTSFFRYISFDSSIINTVNIISPSNFESIKSLSVLLKENSVDNKELVNRYRIQIAKENAFYNIVKETIIIDKTTIDFDDIPAGQYYIRVRVESEVEYGIWCDTLTFLIKTDNSNTTDNNSGSTPITSGDSVLQPVFIQEMVGSLQADNNTTPANIVIVFDDIINKSTLNNVVLIGYDSTYTVSGNVLTVNPVESLKDNTDYNIKIAYIQSLNNSNKYSTNLSYTLTTTLTPMYISINDLMFLVDVYNVSENTVLYYIREASKYVDYVMGNTTTLTDNEITFAITEFIKTKVTLDCLLREWVTISTSSSNTGTLGVISYGENDNSGNSLKNILALLKESLKKWEDALRGYENEGRAKPRYAKKGYKEKYPTTFDSIVSDITRDLPSQV